MPFIAISSNIKTHQSSERLAWTRQTSQWSRDSLLQSFSKHRRHQNF